MLKPITIKDNASVDYKVNDIQSFYQHILRNHAEGTSIHEENGHYFTVDNAFRAMIEALTKSA